MPNFKLTLAYDGAKYCGWQVQARGLSVQGEVERAIVRVTGQQVRVTGSGRTDAGVHALGQVASCLIDTQIEAGQLVRALNANLPLEIRVLDAQIAPDDFHALRDARHKTYRYFVQHGRISDPFQRTRAWYVPGELDFAEMRLGAEHLVGEHDFASFQTAGSPRATTVRHVTRLQIEQQQSSIGAMIVIDISANGFLYNMVRNIVGTLVQVGKRKHSAAWVLDVRKACDRRVAGPTAPPQGLFLVKVDYLSTVCGLG